MARVGRFASRLLFAGVLTGGAYLAWVSSFASPAPEDLLPSGASVVVVARDAGGLARRLSGTRFSSAFGASHTRAWLERTEAAATFDAFLAGVRQATGVSLDRSSAFDLVGDSAAAGWYAPEGAAASSPPWVAAGRLSLRAWAAAAALRVARRFGVGTDVVARSEAAGREVYSWRADGGRSLHMALVGRVLVAGTDRSLVARSAGGAAASVTRETGWRAVREALPARGEFFVWVRDRDLLAGLPVPGVGGRGGAGALVRAGETVTIDVATETGGAQSTADATAQTLPAVALLRDSPLFFFSSSAPAPAALADLLRTRRREVLRRTSGPEAHEAGIRAGRGYAVAVTDAAAGAGLFPVPRGCVVIGMDDAAAAGRALPLLFPPGARSAAAGGTRALATRESFPLAGTFDLWGAAVGPRLVFATETSIIDAVAADGGAAPAGGPGAPPWRVTAVAAISNEKALPLLRRWSAPLSGLIAARWPEAPEITRDLGLLAAVRSVRATLGTDDRRDRAVLEILLRDLPDRGAARGPSQTGL